MMQRALERRLCLLAKELTRCGVSSPHAEVLLFRQKDPKPFPPVRGPSGSFAPRIESFD